MHRSARVCALLYIVLFVSVCPAACRIDSARLFTKDEGQRKKDRRNFHTFSSHQIGQVLRTSPLFEKTGLATNTYFDGERRNRGQVTVWRARTPEEIVEKVGTKVTQHYIRKSQPKAVTNALEIMGVSQ